MEEVKDPALVSPKYGETRVGHASKSTWAARFWSGF